MENPIKYSLEEVDEFTFMREDLLGEGSTAKVYAGVINGTMIAAKYFEADLDHKKRIYEKEKDILMKFSHSNIIKLMGYVNHEEDEDANEISQETRDARVLVLEYAPNTLTKLLDDLNWPQSLRVIRDLASALQYIHNTGYVYCDLKPLNILFDEENNLKLGDMGGVVSADKDIVRFTTEGYGAPEIKATPMFDIFGFGVILMQLMTKFEDTFFPPAKNRRGKNISDIHIAERVQQLVQNKGRYQFPELLGSSGGDKQTAIAIMECGLACAKQNPRARPQSMAEVLAILPI
ncbi:putative leucine-rich repeat receptor-like serine/threonine-protein kinase At2g19230 [Tripterygium wilfordii]|uniref:putative leucine-rich repeat receptor-like serine/threonine-protein kinase At2g19230 n=1 Tax=Tripterygium wilfordii TaxID=458696 RepID=UPI0018F83734|nr:putative leucine-rich repeat receptor-like serine/threonine-protein kinase At2g19230 [Tripterygium wilfordii]